jgi:hypothetical protein
MKNVIVLSTVFAVLAIVGSAGAEIMTDNGLGYVDKVTIHAPGHLADGLAVQAGQNKITYLGEKYLAYCVDLDQPSATGTVTCINVLDVPNGDKIAYLWDTYASQVHDGKMAAALSSAIWEVRYESSGTYDIGRGKFSISGNKDVAKLAQEMLKSIPTETYTPASTEYVLQSDCVQDMLIGSSGSVPEPATMVLLAIGGLATMLQRRKRA